VSIFTTTSRFNSWFDGFSLVVANWRLIVSHYPDMISLVHSPIQENKTDEIHSPIHSPTRENNHSPIQENKGLHIRWRPSAGTSTGNYLYPYLYLGDRCVMYIGGGNKSNPIAQKRAEEIQGLIDREVLQPSMTDEQIRHLTFGVKRRNY